MRNKFTLVLMAITIALTGMFATQTAEAAKRKVVLEDHTGAWCGWCPRGMETLENLEAQFGEQIIGVGVHNGDGMAISSYQSPLAQMIGITGYPNGSVSRINYNGKIAQSDNVWATIAQANVNKDVPVGVTLDVDYDKVTGDFTATITANVESQVNAPLAFNLWLLEDYMKGTGSQWDQQNYLAGRAGYESSKYYSLPSVITGFEHNDVFRYAFGGISGEKGTFPTGNVTAPGTYTQVYTGNVKDLNVDDSFNAYFVAVVHNTTTNELINADRFGKPHYTAEVSAPTITINNSNIYSFIETGKTGNHVIPIMSNHSAEANYEIRLADNSLIPEGWEVNYDKNITIAANGTVNANISVDSKGNKGMATLQFRVYPRVQDAKNWKANFTVVSLSEGTTKAFFAGIDNSSGVVINDLGTVNSFDGVAIIPFAPAQFASLASNYADLFETVVLTVDEAAFVGFAPSQVAANLTAIKNMMNNGTDILIVSVLDLMSYGKSANLNSAYYATAEATTWFRTGLGVEFGLDGNLVVNNQLSSLPVVGVSGDPISNGITFSANSGYNGATFPYYAQRFATMSLNGATSATAFLEIPNPTAPLTTLNNKLGIKIDNNGQRTIYMGLPIESIPTANRSTLLKNMISWLEGGGTTSNGPTISLNTTQVVFGEIKQDQTGTEVVRVTNSGDEALVISAINFKTGTNFAVKGSLPLTIDAGQTVNMNIEFTPTEVKNYSDEITIVSNDAANPNTVITVMGIGTGTSSVTGIIPNVFTMTVGPNPVVNSSEINLDINGSVNLDLELIDATGKVVRNIFSGITTSNTLELNAGQLSSGTYYLNANVNGKTTQLPVVITK
jgi:thiol-disulfide isomerase/thioredoxin